MILLAQVILCPFLSMSSYYVSTGWHCSPYIVSRSLSIPYRNLSIQFALSTSCSLFLKLGILLSASLTLQTFDFHFLHGSVNQYAKNLAIFVALDHWWTHSRCLLWKSLLAIHVQPNTSRDPECFVCLAYQAEMYHFVVFGTLSDLYANKMWTRQMGRTHD